MLTTKAVGLLVTVALSTLTVAGCSSTTTPQPGSSTAPTAPTASSGPASPENGVTTPVQTVDTGATRTTVTFDDADVPMAKEHCEAYVDLNRRIHAQGRKDVADVDAWTALYTEASEKKSQAPEKFKGLYAVIEVWTLELSSTKDGSVSAEARTELGTAIMGNAGVCTAAGVTLPVL